MNNSNEYRDETDDEGNYLRDYDETREEREARQARSYNQAKTQHAARLPAWRDVKHEMPTRDPF